MEADLRKPELPPLPTGPVLAVAIAAWSVGLDALEAAVLARELVGRLMREYGVSRLVGTCAP